MDEVKRSPLFSNCSLYTAVKELLVRRTPSLYHCIVGYGRPVAVQAKAIVSPSVKGSETFGRTTIVGATGEKEKEILKDVHPNSNIDYSHLTSRSDVESECGGIASS